MDVNLLLSNAALYECKVQADFETCLLTFPEIEDFRISFQILKTAGQPMVWKVTLREPIQLEPGETVYMRVNYTGLPKRRSFIMTATYPTAVHTVLDNNILRITILTNPIKKRLEFNKNIRLETIYKCADTVYIMADISKVFAAVATASSVLSDPFSAAQKETIFGNRYQNVNLII